MVTKSKKAKIKEERLEAIRQKVRVEEEEPGTEDACIRDWTKPDKQNHLFTHIYYMIAHIFSYIPPFSFHLYARYLII